MKNRFLTSVIVVAGLIAFGAPGSLFASSPSHLPGYALDNGDINGDWQRDLADPIYLLSFLFRDGPAPAPLAYCGGDLPAVENGDVNGDGYIDIGDPVGFLSWFFKDGAEPALACGMEKAGAGNPNPRVIPPQARPHGKYYGEWSGTWWQWAYSFPAETNPVMDLTGEFAGLGQSGSVWLLAGTFGQTTTRTVTVPTGKALLFPIVNWVWVNIPELGDDPWSDEQEAYARDLLRSLVGPIVSSLTCQVDGKEIRNLENYYCETPPDGEYMMTFPENNIWGIPAGTYGPSVDNGVYLMLAPPSAGEHTIHFTAAAPDGSWGLDVTYNLTIGRP